MPSDAQKKATAKYKKKNVTTKGIAFYPADADLLAWLATKDNVQGYVKELIRSDMEKHGKL